VRLGRERTRRLYAGLLTVALVALPVTLLAWNGPAASLLGLLALPIAVRLVGVVGSRSDGPALNRALAGTGALVGAFSLLVAAGLLVAS
jgi:1,4-dihydroxy-2-naphthoate octaprenyltransferase